MASAPAVDTPHSSRSLSIPFMKEPQSTEAGHTPSADPDVEAARSEVSDKGEKKEEEEEEEEEDTYLHGMKLVCVFTALASSMFLIVLDQTILIPAIPVIASHFNAVSQVGWISSSYFVTQCSTIFLWGQALAFFEQKMPLIMAIVIFELGSLIAAVAPTFVALIVGRSVAGLGGAAIMVGVISISSTVIELKKRPIFFGMFGIMFVLGSALGPIIGGSFTSHATWRWCFYINLPIGGLAVLAISLLVPRTKTPVRAAKPPHFLLRLLQRMFGADRPALAIDGFVSRLTGLDWVGGLIVLGGIVSLTLGLTSGGADGWSSTTVIVCLTVAGVAVILLILWEALVMKEDGIIPLRIARFLSVWGAAGVAFMRMTNSLVIMTYLPLLLQASRHYSSLKSATATLPYAICMAVCAIIGSVIVQKSGRYKWALVLGSAVSAVGAGIMYTLNPTSSFAKIAGFEVIAAVGAGLVQMNAVLAAQADLDMHGLKADIPQASALVSFFQLIGASIGGSLGGAILSTGVRAHTTALPAAVAETVAQSTEEVWNLTGSQRDIAIMAYSLATRNVFLTGAVASAVGVLFALLCRDHNIKGKNYKH